MDTHILMINISIYKDIFQIFVMLRDQEVAGSNPVAPTTLDSTAFRPTFSTGRSTPPAGAARIGNYGFALDHPELNWFHPDQPSRFIRDPFPRQVRLTESLGRGFIVAFGSPFSLSAPRRPFLLASHLCRFRHAPRFAARGGFHRARGGESSAVRVRSVCRRQFSGIGLGWGNIENKELP